MSDAQPTVATETTPTATPATETPPADATQTTTTKKNETKPPEASAKPSDDEKGPVGTAWAKISKRERKLAEDAARIEQQGKELAAREAAVVEFEKALASGKDKPWDTLQEVAKRFGVDARTLIRGATAAALRDKQGKPPTVAAIAPDDVERMIEERVAKALKNYDEQQEQKRSEHASAQSERQLAKFREDIGEHIEGNAAKYAALLRAAPSDPSAPVYALVVAHWEETAKDGKPVLLTIEEASRIVNEQIVSMARDIVTSLEPATETKPKPETDKTAGSKTTPKDGPAASTLTNQHAAEVTTRTNPSDRTSEKRAEKDRIAAAVRALDAQTKK